MLLLNTPALSEDLLQTALGTVLSHRFSTELWILNLTTDHTNLNNHDKNASDSVDTSALFCCGLHIFCPCDQYLKPSSESDQ